MEKLVKFSSGPMHRGISPRTPDFQPTVELDQSTYNMSQGMEQGLAVRHGVSPIPGQQDNETSTLDPRLPGLRMSEGLPSIGLVNRTKVLGWVQLSLPSPSDVTKKITVYGVVVGVSSAGVTYLDIKLCSTLVSNQESISPYVYDGFGQASYLVAAGSPNIYSYLSEGIVAAAGIKTGTIKTYLTFDPLLNSASIATINVTGPAISMDYCFGVATAVGDATHAPSTAYFRAPIHYPGGGVASASIVGGMPSEYSLQNYTISQRSIKVTALTISGGFNISYSVLVTPSSTTFKQDLTNNNSVNLDLSAVTATKDTAGTTYSATAAVLVNDVAATSNASYTAIAIAANKPYACIFQDAFRCNQGAFNQWFDLTQNPWQPPAVASLYEENGIPKSSSFARWPVNVGSSAMLAIIAPQGPALLGANTGVLRKNTTYELTYSIYNKRLNFETNVGTPVKVNVGDTIDFTGIQLWNGNASGTPRTQYERWLTAAAGADNTQHWMPFHFSNFQDALTGDYGSNLAVNFCQYRFYYRQYGTFEWLPAASIDAAQFWFDPYVQLNACTGPIAATPGGQPGGFSDYSPLPVDSYNCVVQYKNRFFWFSDKACVFSLANNIFAYAARNSISATSGKFLGAIVHNYPGQAEQSSRLVIFGTTGNYVARFTGSFSQTQVQVSSDSSATFNIEGSDLVIDPWTSVTAFSYKAAAIADGILYYWGPQGVYRDDGVQTPTKISADLEPYIFTLYDPTTISDIIANYDDLTKEITWYYKSKNFNNETFGSSILIYNTLSGEFLPGHFVGKVDWVQNLNIESDIPTGGKRTVAGIRESFNPGAGQRSYFFDNRNRSGDMYPETDWVIKSISTPVAGSRRLTLASGFSTLFNNIAVGDYLALQQTKSYASSLTSADNMIARISAVNASGYLDIILPTGASLDGSATLTYDKYFPFWTMSPTSQQPNGIPYQMKTVYWSPVGVGGYFFWLYWYLMAKYTAWKTDFNLGWNLKYRTPTSLDFLTDQVTFEDNSDGNFQVYHPLAPGNDNHEGQGLKLVVSGNHIGPEWVLQLMEIHGMPRGGDMLKRFEG